MEAALAEKPWQHVCDNLRVKLLPGEEEVTVFIESGERVNKERAMRRRRMKKLLKHLAALAAKPIAYETLLQKIGAVRHEAGRDARFVTVTLPGLPKNGGPKTPATFTYGIDRDALRKGRRREGRYLLRSNILDVHFPTTDGRELVFSRYTKPEPDQQLVIDALGWKLPPQTPPRITSAGSLEMP